PRGAEGPPRPTAPTRWTARRRSLLAASGSVPRPCGEDTHRKRPRGEFLRHRSTRAPSRTSWWRREAGRCGGGGDSSDPPWSLSRVLRKKAPVVLTATKKGIAATCGNPAVQAAFRGSEP